LAPRWWALASCALLLPMLMQLRVVGLTRGSGLWWASMIRIVYSTVVQESTNNGSRWSSRVVVVVVGKE